MIGKMSLRTLACVFVGFGSADEGGGLMPPRPGGRGRTRPSDHALEHPLLAHRVLATLGMRGPELLPLLQRSSPAATGAEPCLAGSCRLAAPGPPGTSREAQGKEEEPLLWPKTNEEDRPTPSTPRVLGGTGGRKDASGRGAAGSATAASEMATFVGYDAMYRDGIAR